MAQYVNRTLQEFIMKNNSSCITLTVIDHHNMVEEIRVSIIINKNMLSFRVLYYLLFPFVLTYHKNK